MAFAHDHTVVEAFATDAPEQSFADRICPWGFDRRAEDFDP